jgi:hypothetical protein
MAAHGRAHRSAASGQTGAVTSGPSEVGPIEGREVHRDAPRSPQAPPSTPPAHPGPPAHPVPVARPVPGDGSVSPSAVWSDIRRSRGKDVPNSRPLPEWVRRFSWVLDDAFAVPGMPGRRVGVDGVIAIVPVAGDAVGVVLSLVIVVVGVAAGVSVPTILRMLLHIGFEALIGVIPIVGTVFNMAFKANNRNVALIERDLADRRSTRRSSLGVLVLTVGVAMAGVLMLVALSVMGILALVWLLSGVI